MANGASLVLTAIVLLPCSEAARIDMLAETDTFHNFEPDEKLVACQRRHGAKHVWSWFEPDTGNGKDVHDGEELIYKGNVNKDYIIVTWNGEPGKILKANTKTAEHGCKLPSKDPDKHPIPTPGDQLPLVIAHCDDARHGVHDCKIRFTPNDEDVASPDPSGINSGQVMQCLDKPCHLHSSRVSVLFRGVEGRVEGRHLIWGTKVDYDDFYNPDVLMGPCGARLARLSQEKMDLVRKLFTIHDPASLGHGADVQDGRPTDYNKLRIRSVCEVLDRSPKIEAYKQRVTALNKKHNGAEFHLDSLYDNTDIFPPSGLNQPSREKGWLEENEYWLVRGADPKYSASLVCTGGAMATEGMFGHGIYLADSADKMDQYVSPVDKDAAGLEWALNSNKDPLVEAAAESGTKSVGMEPRDVYVGEVMRAYMGHHVELQVKRGHRAFWRDPAVHGEGRDRTTRSSERTPPFGDTEFDSMKVVCSDAHHEKRHPGCDKRGEGHDKGNFPYRWNEYVVPGPDGLNPRRRDGFSFTETAVLKFLVVYDRVQ